MARRTNYIEYFLPQVTASVASATVRAFDPIWIMVPETGSRNWESVWLEFTCRDNNAAAASISHFQTCLSISNGSGSHTVAPVNLAVGTITNTGEHQSDAFACNYTSWFNSNFTTLISERVLMVSAAIVGPATSNWAAKLCMCYSYDDTAQTQRIKTVKIPLESVPLTYGTTLRELGGVGSWSVPLLDTFLPEGSKIYRDIAFEFFNQEAGTGTTDFTTRCQLDAETAQADGNHESALNSQVWYKRIWKRLGTMTTSAPHRVLLGASAARWHVCGGILNVTYEYNTANTTQTLNSLWMPFEGMAGSVGLKGSWSGGVPSYVDYTEKKLQFWVQEPNPAMVNSGIVVHWFDQIGISRPAFSVNGSLSRSYDANNIAINWGGLACGGRSVVHRFDSGSVSGSVTVSRGLNEITLQTQILDTLGGTPGTGLNFSALALINYTSGIASGGLGTHNHTVCCQVLTRSSGTHATVQGMTQGWDGIMIPEPRYWLNNLGFEYMCTHTTHLSASIALEVLPQSMDTGVSGWKGVSCQEMCNIVNAGAGELSLNLTNVAATKLFRQHPTDQWTYPKKMYPTGSKVLRIYGSDAATPWFWWSWGKSYATYHSIVSMISGSVVNWSSGDGSGIGVEVYRKRDNYMCLSMSTATGGTFGENWYDDTEEYYCVAIPNSRSMGRSKAATPS